MSALSATKWRHVVLALATMSFSPAASAFESDVHFGLTRWLALKAGFDASQAQAIAVADQRVDSGFLDFQTLTLDVACVGRFADDARRIQRFHFPAARPLPAPAAERAVAPGSRAARDELAALSRQLAGKAGLMLGKFGEALHPLQDSWSNQGAPDVPAPARVGCDPSLASAPAVARGGWASHDASLTHRWQRDVVEMAHASYEALMAYPRIQGAPRDAVEWSTLVAPVEAFARAATKTAKAEWFRAEGQSDVSFLDAISLPDGPSFTHARWTGDKFPALPGDASTQFDAPQDARLFVDAVLHRWISAEPVEATVLEAMGVDRRGPRPADAKELVARLTLWKLKDHGSVTALAHKPGRFGSAELASIERIARKRDAFIAPGSFDAVLFPLQAIGPDASPLLPYILRPVPGSSRSIAITRLRHLPYDELGWIVERRDGRWVLVDVVAIVGR